MTDPHEILFKRYLQLPDRLEAALAGLDEAGLDLKGEGWSIRAYVHHAVEGELMWQLYLRAILRTAGMEFPIQWYFCLPQEEWAERWAYGKRSVGPSLIQFRGSTASLVELLRNIPPEAWSHTGHVTWPGDDKETRLSVRDIVLIHIRHIDQHTADMQAIRKLHGR